MERLKTRFQAMLTDVFQHVPEPLLHYWPRFLGIIIGIDDLVNDRILTFTRRPKANIASWERQLIDSSRARLHRQSSGSKKVLSSFSVSLTVGRRDGSAKRVLVPQAYSPEFGAQSLCKNLGVVIPALESWRQRNPGSELDGATLAY